MKTKNRIWYLLLPIVLLSCAGTRVTSNGKKIPLASLPSTVDSVFVIGRFDRIKVGPTAKLISTTHIQGPWQDMKTPILQHYLNLKNLAMRECVRLGGNTCVIKDYHNLYTSAYSSSDMLVDIYEVPEIDLNALKDQVTSALSAHRDSLKNKCTVHVQFGGRPISGGFEVFFNDKLQFSPKSSVTGFTVKNDVYNFSWSEPGKFLVKSYNGNPRGDSRALEIDKEYFFFAVKFGNEDVLITELTKEQFENELYRTYGVINRPTN